MFSLSLEVRGTFDFGVYENVRLLNTKGSCFYLTVVFADRVNENQVYQEAHEHLTKMCSIDPQIIIDVSTATFVHDLRQKPRYDMVIGKVWCEKLKGSSERVTSTENPFDIDPPPPYELHSNLFCQICLEDNENGETIINTTCCNKACHESCLKKHEKETKCPMCSTTLEKPDMPCKRSDAGQGGSDAGREGGDAGQEGGDAGQGGGETANS